MARLLGATVVAAILMLGCDCPDGGWNPPSSLNLGVSSNLHAVVEVEVGGYDAIAVGSAGTVVAWGYRGSAESFDTEWFTQTSTVGDAELRGVADAGNGRWVVVGDGGFAALSEDYGQTWTVRDLETTSDLHAAVAIGERVVVVGDEVVRVLEGDAWLQPPTPAGGWGRLRGIGPSELNPGDPRIFAVGVGGVIWSTYDPTALWEAEPSGVDVDLFAVGAAGVVGANATFLVHETDGWRAIETDRTVDFIDFDDLGVYGLLMLTADGEILRYDWQRGFERLDRIPGAARILQDEDGLVAVGDAGLAVRKRYVWCE